MNVSLGSCDYCDITCTNFRTAAHISYSIRTNRSSISGVCVSLLCLYVTAEFKEAVNVGLKLGKLKLSIADNKVCMLYVCGCQGDNKRMALWWRYLELNMSQRLVRMS